MPCFFKHYQVSLTACLAWMLADPSAKMFWKMGLRVFNTSSLSIPEPSWIHSRHAKEAAARCSSPFPKTEMRRHLLSQDILTSYWKYFIIRLISLCDLYNTCNYDPSEWNYFFAVTFLEASLNAVGDGHPSLGDELIQDSVGHGCLEPIQCPLSGLGTKTRTTHKLLICFMSFPSLNRVQH